MSGVEDTADYDAVLAMLGRMHLDAVRNGDWGGAAALAAEIERLSEKRGTRAIPPAVTEPTS